MGEEARQLSRREESNSMPRLGSRASDAVELAALADASRFLPAVGCSWWGSRYYDVALGAEGGYILRGGAGTLIEPCLRSNDLVFQGLTRPRRTTAGNVLVRRLLAGWETPQHSVVGTSSSTSSAADSSRLDLRGPAPSQPGVGGDSGSVVSLARALAATANMESPANRNVRLRSCRPIAGRVGGRLAWRWLQGYGAAGAGTDCQVVAEPVRWGAGQVRGHAGAPLSRAPGGSRASLGAGAAASIWRAGLQEDLRGAARAGRAWTRVPDGAAFFKGRARGGPREGEREANAGGRRGLVPSPPRPKETSRENG